MRRVIFAVKFEEGDKVALPGGDRRRLEEKERRTQKQKKNGVV